MASRKQRRAGKTMVRKMLKKADKIAARNKKREAQENPMAVRKPYDRANAVREMTLNLNQAAELRRGLAGGARIDKNMGGIVRALTREEISRDVAMLEGEAMNCFDLLATEALQRAFVAKGEEVIRPLLNLGEGEHVVWAQEAGHEPGIEEGGSPLTEAELEHIKNPPKEEQSDLDPAKPQAKVIMSGKRPLVPTQGLRRGNEPN